MNINGVNNLFPLSHIRPGYVGYFMDVNGHVYSTRQFTTPKKLSGSTTGYGAMQRTMYTFTVTGRRNTIQEAGSTLFAEAKRHALWTKETSALAAVSMPDFAKGLGAVNKVDNSIHAATVVQGIKQRGYIIGQIVSGSDAIVFGSKPKIHMTEESVKAEVARLAAKSPGTQIIYVKIMGAATCHALAWA